MLHLLGMMESWNRGSYGEPDYFIPESKKTLNEFVVRKTITEVK